jgi:hypothetical protein
LAGDGDEIDDYLAQMTVVLAEVMHAVADRSKLIEQVSIVFSASRELLDERRILLLEVEKVFAQARRLGNG